MFRMFLSKLPTNKAAESVAVTSGIALQIYAVTLANRFFENNAQKSSPQPKPNLPLSLEPKRLR